MSQGEFQERIHKHFRHPQVLVLSCEYWSPNETFPHLVQRGSGSGRAACQNLVAVLTI